MTHLCVAAKLGEVRALHVRCCIAVARAERAECVEGVAQWRPFDFLEARAEANRVVL